MSYLYLFPHLAAQKDPNGDEYWQVDKEKRVYAAIR